MKPQTTFVNGVNPFTTIDPNYVPPTKEVEKRPSCLRALPKCEDTFEDVAAFIKAYQPIRSAEIVDASGRCVSGISRRLRILTAMGVISRRNIGSNLFLYQWEREYIRPPAKTAPEKIMRFLEDNPKSNIVAIRAGTSVEWLQQRLGVMRTRKLIIREGLPYNYRYSLPDK